MDDRDPDSISPFEMKTGMDPFVSALRIEQIDVGYRLREVDPLKVAALKASIEELGLRMPITVSGSGLPSDPEARFKLVAGAHRLAAIRDLGREFIGGYVVSSDDLDAELWEIDENLCRAELTPADRALFVFRRKELYLLKHPETANGGDRRSDRQVGELKSNENKRFTSATAEATGQSERAVQRDAERGEKISDKALRMLRGTHHDKGVVLDRLKSLRESEQEIYVKALFDADKVKQAEAKEVRTSKMATKRAIRTGVINAIAAHGTVSAGQMPRAACPIGYADPPWQQEAWSDETGQDKGLMYPPMPLDDIKALCAGENSPFTPDAKLYLWVPTNRLDDGIEVMRAWGFDYVSAITWDKVHIGMGREVRDRTEHLLIGKRGDFPGLVMGEQTESLYSEPRSEHSRKPVWFAEQIDRLYPSMRKLELFQRKASLANDDVRRNGMWEFWGFEAGDDAGDVASAKADSIDGIADKVDGKTDSKTTKADKPAASRKSKDKVKKPTPYELERLASQQRRKVYRDTIPSDISDEDLIAAAKYNLSAYHDAVLATREDSMSLAADKIVALGEHLFGLPADYDWGAIGAPPQGSGRFGCLSDARKWLSEKIAAADGEIPLYGQGGRFLVELFGCRVDLEYDGLAAISGFCSAHVVDLDKLFFSETGFRSFQVFDSSHLIYCGGLGLKEFVEKACTAQLTEGGKRKVKLHPGPFGAFVKQGPHEETPSNDRILARRQSDPAYQPGGFLHAAVSPESEAA